MSAGRASKQCQNRLDVKCLKSRAPYRYDIQLEPLQLTRRIFRQQHLPQSGHPRQQHRTPRTNVETSRVLRGEAAQWHAQLSRQLSWCSPCLVTNILHSASQGITCALPARATLLVRVRVEAAFRHRHLARYAGGLQCPQVAKNAFDLAATCLG